MKRYRPILQNPQITQVNLQRHCKVRGDKILILFEGRDAAGKHAAIKRIAEPNCHERRQRTRIGLSAQETIGRSLSLINAPRGGKDLRYGRQLFGANPEKYVKHHRQHGIKSR